MNRGKTIAIIGVLGILTYMKFGKTLGFNAENSKGMKTIVKRIRDRFNPSDLEEVTKERSGQTVDTLPINYSPAVSQAGHFAFDKTVTYVNDAPYGPGVSDVKISVQDAYADSLNAEDFQVFNAVAPGQEIIPAPVKQLKSIQPTSESVCCKPITSYGGAIASLELPSVSRAALPMMSGDKTMREVDPNSNENFTDGSKTQSIAQWMHEGHVDMMNPAYAIFRPHIGGVESRLRRV